MVIEIFGFPLNLEIRIGDILGASIATIGLILSAIIFYIGYRRTTRTEQFKLFMEIYHRMDETNNERMKYGKSMIYVDDWSTLPEKEQKKRFAEFLGRVERTTNQVAILTYLWHTGDLPNRLVEPQTGAAIRVIKELISNYEDDPLKDPLNTKSIAYLQELLEFWREGKPSRFQEFTGRFKEVFHIR